MSKFKAAAKKAVDAVKESVTGEAPAAAKPKAADGCDHDSQFVGIDCHRKKHVCTKCGAVEFRE